MYFIEGLYEDCDPFHERLQKMDKEWPGAAILVIKTQVLPQVSTIDLGAQGVYLEE